MRNVVEALRLRFDQRLSQREIALSLGRIPPLTFLPRLRASAVEVVEIPGGAHLVFYDTPVAMYEAIGACVRRHATPG